MGREWGSPARGYMRFERRWFGIRQGSQKFEERTHFQFCWFWSEERDIQGPHIRKHRQLLCTFRGNPSHTLTPCIVCNHQHILCILMSSPRTFCKVLYTAHKRLQSKLDLAGRYQTRQKIALIRDQRAKMKAHHSIDILLCRCYPNWEQNRVCKECTFQLFLHILDNWGGNIHKSQIWWGQPDLERKFAFQIRIANYRSSLLHQSAYGARSWCRCLEFRSKFYKLSHIQCKCHQLRLKCWAYTDQYTNFKRGRGLLKSDRRKCKKLAGLHMWDNLQGKVCKHSRLDLQWNRQDTAQDTVLDAKTRNRRYHRQYTYQLCQHSQGTLTNIYHNGPFLSCKSAKLHIRLHTFPVSCTASRPSIADQCSNSDRWKVHHQDKFCTDNCRANLWSTRCQLCLCNSRIGCWPDWTWKC